MKGARIAAVLLIPLMGMPTGVLAATPTITHQKLSCIPADGNAKIYASVSSSASLASVRVYYHAEQFKQDYYMEMRRAEENLYWATLPIPKSETKQVEYRIVTKDMDGAEGTTEKYVVDVKSNCDSSLTEVEKKYASNLVIGLTDDQQNPIPDGFKCDGVISKITVIGVLMPNDECTHALFIPWVAAGAAVVGAGVIVLGDDTKKPVSPYRPAPQPK